MLRNKHAFTSLATLASCALLAVGTAVQIQAADKKADPSGTWHVSGATFYGPGLFGNHTACGQTLTPETQGVAHRTLPCGTMVEFEWHGRHAVVPVIDRGPYGSSAEWDLTQATCHSLSAPGDSRCMTWEIAWRT